LIQRNNNIDFHFGVRQMQIVVYVPDALPQSFIQREVKQFEEKLRKQAEDEVAGSFSHYANAYISTNQAVQQAWDEIVDDKYNGN
jgi:hypothetical protein